jgi:alpha-tubulin suppressor-like RCC1 family protein
MGCPEHGSLPSRPRSQHPRHSFVQGPAVLNFARFGFWICFGFRISDFLFTHVSRLCCFVSVFCALGASPVLAGSVVAWGCNEYGAINVPADLTDVVAISAGRTHSLALRADHTVVTWGKIDSQWDHPVPADLSNALAVSAGGYHNLALRTDHTVAVWGDNWAGQLNIPTNLSHVVAISAGWTHSLALKDDGRVVAWGLNSSGECDPPPDLTNAVAIASARFASFALRSDGTVTAWGGGEECCGESQVPPGLSHVVAIAAGAYHGLALKEDGTVAAWGYHETAWVPDGLTNVVAIAAGEHHSLALRSDGRSVVWSSDSWCGEESVPPDLRSVRAISAGAWHNLVLTDDCTAITVQPWSRTVSAGANVTLAVMASGFPPFRYQWQRNGSDIPGAIQATLTLSHVQPADAGDYSVIVSDSEDIVVSETAMLSVLPVLPSLGEALDAPDLEWRTGGQNPWYGQSEVTYDGVDAARSGAVDYQQENPETWLETTVAGPGLISFYWKVSTLDQWYYLSFRLDDSLVTNITGETDWRRHSFYVPPGEHILRWDYSRSDEERNETDAGWVDEVSFTGSPPVPPTVLITPPGTESQAEEDVEFTAQPEGTEPFSYQWQWNGADLAGQISQELRLLNVDSSRAGQYRVTVGNLAGSITSAPVSLVVHPAPRAWSWVRQFGDVQREVGSRVAVDGAGNVGVAGGFDGTTIIGTNILTSAGLADSFFAKYSPQGELLWVRQFAGSDWDEVQCLAADGAGYWYVAGMFHSEIHIGPLSLNAGERLRVFLAKIDPDGQPVWARQCGGYMSEDSVELAVDSAGHAVLWAATELGATFGDFTFTNSSGRDLYLARYSPDGEAQWARQFANGRYDQARSVTVNNAGQAYFSGEFHGALTVGTNELVGRYPGGAQYGIFLAQCETNGTVLWARAGESNCFAGYDLALDPSGHLYSQCHFFGAAQVGTNTLLAGEGGNYFIARLDADGQALWGRLIRNVGFDTSGGYCLATDPYGRTYLLARFDNTVVVDGRPVFYRPSDTAWLACFAAFGDVLWTRKVSGYATDLAVDRTGNVYLTGAFEDSLALDGNPPLLSRGQQDGFLAKLGVVETLAFAPVPSSGALSNGWFSVRLIGLQGRGPVVIEGSTNLIDWVDALVGTALGEPQHIDIPVAPDQETRFFRARLQPAIMSTSRMPGEE